MIKENNKIYDDFYKDNWIDGWEEKDKRHNFWYLFKIENYCDYPLSKSSILDVGCGSGDMVKYLINTSKYLGIDIYRPAIKLAKQKYKDSIFKYGNVLTFKSTKKFDYVICSGALSVNHGNNYKFINDAITNMWKLCKKGITFNVLSDEKIKNTKKDILFVYDIEEVKHICMKIVGKQGKCFNEFNPIDRDNNQHTIYLVKI